MWGCAVIIRLLACAVVTMGTLAASGCEAADPAAEDPPPTQSATTESPAAANHLPDEDGPVGAPVGPPYTAGVLMGVSLDTSIAGADVVTFMFAGTPQCTGTRLQELPAGTPPAQGNAFVQLTCTPAEPRQRPPDVVGPDDYGYRAAREAAAEGRAASDDMVNVIEAVQTSTEGDALVWTIGLRHSAPWGIGALSTSPMVVIAQ
jgi:hypothetical protein